jgi:mannose-6-phosphate isomerase-like protein (cupin superfamily)
VGYYHSSAFADYVYLNLMTITLEGGCRVSNMHDGEPLAEGSVRIWNQVNRATGAQAISLRIVEFAPGLSPGIRNGDCDEILYALNSERDRERGHPVRLSEHSERISSVEVLGEIFIDGHPFALSPDTGIYIRPHETFAINNPGPGQIVIVSAQCPEPDQQPQFVTPLTSADSAASIESPLVGLADRRAQPTADRWYRVLVDDEIGSANATQFVGSIPPGRAPDHFHQYEEVLFILKGEGRMWASETSTPITPGSCIYLPKGQVHCVENTGKDELRLLGVFYPAGSPSVRYDA